VGPGVHHQVEQRLGEAALVGPYDEGRRVGDLDVVEAEAGDPPAQLVEDVGGEHRADHDAGAVGAAGDGTEVVDDAGDAVELGPGGGRHLRGRGRVLGGRRLEQLEVAPGHRQRGPQLVRHRGHEAPALLVVGVDAVEHAVE